MMGDTAVAQNATAVVKDVLNTACYVRLVAINDAITTKETRACAVRT
jgi:hypothetical protein